ncbi:MAG: hypothetical protein ABW089_09545 [Sedimenticola sp.]
MRASLARRPNGLAFPMFRILFCLLIVSFVTPVTLSAAEDDDYLKAIEMETDKVERKQSAEDAGPETVNGGGGAGFSRGLSIEDFAQELKEKYTGSSVFYKKLPRRTQEEIYQDYFKGSSYEQVQKKIMNRYLGR